MALLATTESSGAVNVPAPEEFVARARALAPKLRERATESERIRRMPDATVEDFRRAEFMRIMQPARYGGCEYGWDVWVECLIELARGSASQAWAMMVHCEYTSMLQGFSSQAQDDIWLESPGAIISSSFQPMGKLEAVEGGFTLQSIPQGPKWGFSSGCSEADWFIIGGVLPPKGWTFFLVPRSAITIHEDWNVMGLLGSGSHSLTIDEPVFIPEYRVAADRDLDECTGPGAGPDAPPMSRYARKAGSSAGIAAVSLGAALGMLDDFQALARAQVAGRNKQPSDQMVALRIAETQSDLEAAQMMLLGSLRDHWAIVKSGATLSRQQRLDARRIAGYSALLAQRASQRMISAAGPDALGADSPLQRAFRDVQAGSNHMGVSWEMAATAPGEFAIGLEPAPGSY